MKSVYMSLLAIALMSTSVLAQQTPAAPSTTPSQTTAPAKHAGEWRASKLIGLDIYNQQNEKIGDINEVLLDQNGKVVGYILGVGGFLGMGEHDVLVRMDQIKFSNEAVRRADSPATTGATRSDARPSTTDRRAERSADEKWYPDHGIMNATKDQLKALPEFKYSSYN